MEDGGSGDYKERVTLAIKGLNKRELRAIPTDMDENGNINPKLLKEGYKIALVYGIVVDSGGRFLITKRRDDDKLFPGLYGVPAGHARIQWLPKYREEKLIKCWENEPNIDAVNREIWEETRLVPSKTESLQTLGNMFVLGKKYVCMGYFCPCYFHGEPVISDELNKEKSGFKEQKELIDLLYRKGDHFFNVPTYIIDSIVEKYDRHIETPLNRELEGLLYEKLVDDNLRPLFESIENDNIILA